jgi:hypothetical protein
LEPSGVGAPDLHVVGSTGTLDIPWLVVISSSDSLRLLVEVPNLCFSTVSSLDNEVSVVDQIKISVWSHLWYNIEVSFDVKSEVLVKFSLLWLFVFINIDDLELLSSVFSSISNLDVSILHISVDTLVLNL